MIWPSSLPARDHIKCKSRAEVNRVKGKGQGPEELESIENACEASYSLIFQLAENQNLRVKERDEYER